jgi:hypothetical protein
LQTSDASSQIAKYRTDQQDPLVGFAFSDCALFGSVSFVRIAVGFLLVFSGPNHIAFGSIALSFCVLVGSISRFLLGSFCCIVSAYSGDCQSGAQHDCDQTHCQFLHN